MPEKLSEKKTRFEEAVKSRVDVEEPAYLFNGSLDCDRFSPNY